MSSWPHKSFTAGAILVADRIQGEVNMKAILGVLSASCLTAVVGACSASAAAAEFPARPITLVVPFGAGGITDITARAVGKALSAQVGQAVVVENKPGAGGNIAADYVRRAAPDGYTLMFTTVGVLAVNPHTGMNVSFDSAKDFSYISLVSSTPHVITVNPAVKAADLRQLIEQARGKPESLSFGTAGVGSSPYQGMQIMQESEKVRFLHIPFKSGSESVTSVVAGQVDVTFEATPVVMPFVRAQKLKALAVAHTERIPGAPDVPSTKELGYPELISGSGAGVVAPAGVPAEVIAKLNDAIVKAVATDDFQRSMREQGTAAQSSSPAEFATLIANENQRWSRILATASK